MERDVAASKRNRRFGYRSNFVIPGRERLSCSGGAFALLSFAAANFLSRPVCSYRADLRSEIIDSNSSSRAAAAMAQSLRIPIFQPPEHEGAKVLLRCPRSSDCSMPYGRYL